MQRHTNAQPCPFVADLSAKANAQEVVAGMLGMGLGIALSSAVGDAMHAAFLAYAGAAYTNR